MAFVVSSHRLRLFSRRSRPGEEQASIPLNDKRHIFKIWRLCLGPGQAPTVGSAHSREGFKNGSVGLNELKYIPFLKNPILSRAYLNFQNTQIEPKYVHSSFRLVRNQHDKSLVSSSI